jgi:hypothetical protein
MRLNESRDIEWRLFHMRPPIQREAARAATALIPSSDRRALIASCRRIPAHRRFVQARLLAIQTYPLP